MAVNMNMREAIESLVNKGASMLSQFADTCANAVVALGNKPDKLPADVKKADVYGKKVEELKSEGAHLRELADQQQVGKPTQTPSND